MPVTVIDVTDLEDPVLAFRGVKPKTDPPEPWEAIFVLARAVPRGALTDLMAALQAAPTGTGIVYNRIKLESLVEALLLDDEDRQRWADLMSDPTRQIPATKFAEGIQEMFEGVFELPFRLSSTSPG